MHPFIDRPHPLCQEVSICYFVLLGTRVRGFVVWVDHRRNVPIVDFDTFL